MSVARTTFIETVSLPAAAATSVATLMRSSIQSWGLEADGITPSLDSFDGDELSVTPQAPVYIGNSANVRDVNATPLYQGILIAAAATFLLQDFAKGAIVDPTQVYLYSQSGCNVALMFHGR